MLIIIVFSYSLSKWKKVLETETARIPHDDKSTILKSAICGFLAGDGSVQVRKDKLPHHYQIDFFPDDKKMLDYYCKFIKKIYNKMPSLSRRDNVFVARLSHKYIVIDLLKYCNFGIYTWNLPIELFNVPGAKEASMSLCLGFKSCFVEGGNFSGFERSDIVTSYHKS